MATCPFIHQNCLKSKCVMWITVHKRDDARGLQEAVETCGIAQQPIFLVELMQLLKTNIAMTDRIAQAEESQASAINIAIRNAMQTKRRLSDDSGAGH